MCIFNNDKKLHLIIKKKIIFLKIFYFLYLVIYQICLKRNTNCYFLFFYFYIKKRTKRGINSALILKLKKLSLVRVNTVA